MQIKAFANKAKILSIAIVLKEILKPYLDNNNILTASPPIDEGSV